jgi:hypothetical protein
MTKEIRTIRLVDWSVQEIATLTRKLDEINPNWMFFMPEGKKA